MAIEQSLLDLGLDQKAAHIYLALLRASKMTISEIARASGVKRGTCYEHLDTLLERDFIIRTPVGKRTFYSAVEPKKVLAAFKRRTADLEHSIIELEKIHDTGRNRPRVEYYEGKRELRSIYEQLFKTIGDAHSIFPAESFFQSFTEADYDEFDREISRHALQSHDLLSQDRYYKKIKEMRAKNGGDSKYDKKLPKEFKNNVDVLIFSDKVALISLRDLSAIVIENADIADLFRSMHGFIWKQV